MDLVHIKVNADDFGMSPGINAAIAKMCERNRLNSASMMTGFDYLNEAVEIAKLYPKLQVGLHFNLTNGKSVAGNLPLLTDDQGNFKNGFLKVLILSFFKKEKLLNEVSKELEAQILRLQSLGIEIDHINGHRHVHYIPGIFKVVINTAREHNIPNVRIINESFWHTLCMNHIKSFLWDGGVIKWFILRFLGTINGSRIVATKTYFFSILYTGRISYILTRKITVPKKFNEVEIMIHPGDPNIDKNIADLSDAKHVLSKARYVEQL